MKTNRAIDTRVRRQLLAVIVALLAATLASCGASAWPPPPPPWPPPPPPPKIKIGGLVFGVECDPATRWMKHGETEEIGVEEALPVNLGGWGKVTEFKIINIIGDGQIEVSQRPAPNEETGLSIIPGAIQVKSLAVDGPRRTVTYYINVQLYGGGPGNQVSLGSLWCQVDVIHIAPTPTPTPTLTPTSTPTFTPTPKPKGAYIITDDGFRVTYTGPLKVPPGGTLAAPFQVWTPDDLPAKGELTVTLRTSASDPDAVHATAELDAQGKVTILLNIGDYPDGTILELLFSHLGKVYFLTYITVTP